MQWAKKQKGFTIVELLIVVVVIAILATITIVSYNGIQNRARQAAAKSAISDAIKTIELAKVTSSTGAYPDSPDIKSSNGLTLTYAYNAAENTYCVQAVNGTVQYSATNFSTDPIAGNCGSNGLVGWWRLNGDGNDSSGSLPATLTGVPSTGQNGQANGAYLFNGSQTGVVAGSGGIIPSTMSFSFWVRPTSWNTGAATAFIGKRSSSTSDGVFIMYLTSSTSLSMDCGGSSNRWSPGYVPQLNQWTHFVITCTANTITAYANGVLIGSTTRTNINLSNSTEIGFGHDRGTYNLNGSMDDIRLYKRALSGAEALQLFNEGAQ